MPRPLGLFLLLVLGTAAGAGRAAAEDEAFRKAWQARVAQTATELETFARTCHEAKLFAWRNEAYEHLLLFDADHAAARTWLKYRRGKDGTWQRGTYKPPRNLSSASEALASLRAAVGGRFADRALALLAEHRAVVAPARRLAALRFAARLAPDREDVHAQLGEVRGAQGGWVLQESLPAIERRRALAAFATAAVQGAAAPREDRPTSAENGLGLGWSAIYESGHARILGTVEKPELLRAAARVEAAYATFLHALDLPPPKAPPLTFYVLGAAGDRDAILAKHAAATEAYRTWAKQLQSSWLPKTTDIWIHAPDADLRLEWCSRQVAAHLLSRAFGVRGSPGWAFEGFGLYLSHLVAGQRRTFFVKRTEYAAKETRKNDLWDRLREKGTDWRKEARALLASEAAPDLRLLLGKQLNDMNTEDMLVSYALCAFLLEGHPKDVPEILTKIGKDKQASVDVLTAAGLDPETLSVNLRRWLEETP